MFCQNCGKNLPDKAKFCAGCGNNIASEQATEKEQAPNSEVNLFEPDDQNYQYRKSGQIKFGNGKKKGGCFKSILIGVGILVILLIVAALFNNGEVSVSTANFKDVQTASEIKDNKAVVLTSMFSTNSNAIYVVGVLDNAPSETKIKGEWYYLEQQPAILIDSALLETKDLKTNFNFSLSKPNNGWPIGKYEVKLYIDDQYKQSVNFNVQ